MSAMRDPGALPATFSIGAAAGAMATASRAPEPLRPAAVTLHRFDLKPGQQTERDAWIGYLERNHRAAVATLGRERMHAGAMFVQPDEPGRFYWVTIQGAGGHPVETATSELDRRHMASMDAVLAKGSNRRAAGRNVLLPDFIVAAIRRQKQVER